MNLTICLVAYSQKFTETVSFYSLLNLTKNLKENINLYIFDNGSEDFRPLMRSWILIHFIA